MAIKLSRTMRRLDVKALRAFDRNKSKCFRHLDEAYDAVADLAYLTALRDVMEEMQQAAVTDPWRVVLKQRMDQLAIRRIMEAERQVEMELL